MAGGLEKGFEEKGLGFCVAEVENGFVFSLLIEVGFALNRVLPRFCRGGFGMDSWPGVALLRFSLFFPATGLTNLTALTALMLPSLLRQGFFLQANMYSLLSWDGKRSGRSPFNCRSRVIVFWQRLHLANWASGEHWGSSHV